MKVGSIVYSMAGHDKERFYVVVRLEDGFAYIADGKRRKLDRPKKKSAKHLRGTSQTLDLNIVATDKKLRSALGSLNQAAPTPPNEREE